VSGDFYRDLLRERFGPVPTAELHRPLAEAVGAGGPDTEEKVRHRIRILMALDSDGEVA